VLCNLQPRRVVPLPAILAVVAAALFYNLSWTLDDRFWRF
jgi:hypothetical protein